MNKTATLKDKLASWGGAFRSPHFDQLNQMHGAIVDCPLTDAKSTRGRERGVLGSPLSCEANSDEAREAREERERRKVAAARAARAVRGCGWRRSLESPSGAKAKVQREAPRAPRAPRGARPKARGRASAAGRALPHVTHFSCLCSAVLALAGLKLIQTCSSNPGWLLARFRCARFFLIFRSVQSLTNLVCDSWRL